MKRSIAMILILTLMLSLAACGKGQSIEVKEPEQNIAQEAQTPAPQTEQLQQAEATAEPEATADPEVLAEPEVQTEPEAPAEPEPEAAGTKTLVIYFSSANTVDAVSAATPYFDGVASTAVLANLIAGETGADVAKLTPVTDYPESYQDTADAARQEQNDNARPAFVALDVDPEDYDVIFIGYPVWWYELPMILDTFFDAYDFTGKTLIPFNTHEGSRDGGTWQDIEALEPGATVLEGIAVRGGRVDGAESDVHDWLKGLGYSE